MSLRKRACILTAAALLAGFASPRFAAAQNEPATAGEDRAEDLVEVSLGDWGVKTRLASDLSRRISEIPLTISVPSDVASKVCPLDTSDLEQQGVVSPTRTCAAKTTSDELREEVRRVIGTE